ncbi:MAG: protein-glutamate O-methyltransferase CheR [Chloroflexota bacterium]
MTSEEVALWRSLIVERCGLFFTDSRLYYLAQRLWERMQIHHFSAYDDYYRYLLLSRHGEREWLLLLEQLLNNETRFFRHGPSYRALREKVLFQLWEQKKDSEAPLQVWSVGCSGGQEVYSLAMLLLEWELFEPEQITITGSDISCGKLQQARNGRYHSFEVESLPTYYRRKYMTQLDQGRDTIYEVTSDIRRLTEFSYLNLQVEPLEERVDRLDIIFCQNVLIYFTNELRSKIVNGLSHCLQPGGFIFFAPTDIVGLKMPHLRPVHFPDALVFQRVVA